MLLLVIIAGVVVWSSGALLVLALCRGARLGDEAEQPLAALSDMRPHVPVLLGSAEAAGRSRSGARLSRPPAGRRAARVDAGARVRSGR